MTVIITAVLHRGQELSIQERHPRRRFPLAGFSSLENIVANDMHHLSRFPSTFHLPPPNNRRVHGLESFLYSVYTYMNFPLSHPPALGSSCLSMINIK